MMSKRNLVLAVALPLLAVGAFLFGRAGAEDAEDEEAPRARREVRADRASAHKGDSAAAARKKQAAARRREVAALATNLVTGLVAKGIAHETARAQERKDAAAVPAARATTEADRRHAERIGRRLEHLEREKARKAKRESAEVRQLREAYEKLRAQEETPALRQAREAYERQRDLEKAAKELSHHGHRHHHRRDGNFMEEETESQR